MIIRDKSKQKPSTTSSISSIKLPFSKLKTIFVTVGTTQFDQLIKLTTSTEFLICAHRLGFQHVLIQYGKSPLHISSEWEKLEGMELKDWEMEIGLKEWITNDFQPNDNHINYNNHHKHNDMDSDDRIKKSLLEEYIMTPEWNEVGVVDSVSDRDGQNGLPSSTLHQNITSNLSKYELTTYRIPKSLLNPIEQQQQQLPSPPPPSSSPHPHQGQRKEQNEQDTGISLSTDSSTPTEPSRKITKEFHNFMYISFYQYAPSLIPSINLSTLILSHCGSGTILDTLDQQRYIIVVVNDTLMHNHQHELGDVLDEEGVVVCTNVKGVLNQLELGHWRRTGGGGIKGKGPPIHHQRNEGIFVKILDELMGFPT